MIQIQVVGPGCSKCNTLESLCKRAVEHTGVEARVEKVSDINRFAELNVFITPGLLINGKLKSVGRLPSSADLESWLKAAQDS
jgi:small redox-active disulfide protein 2